jgi:hypothetical protein
MNQKITSLYEHYKDTPKKLKIVCDWDEVIQAHEPYCLYQITANKETETFSEFFNNFWEGKDSKEKSFISYSPYGSRLNIALMVIFSRVKKRLKLPLIYINNNHSYQLLRI